MFESVIAKFSLLPEIEAIALGGSRSGIHYDASSDYDIYLYCSNPVSEEKRLEILEKYCSSCAKSSALSFLTGLKIICRHCSPTCFQTPKS